MSAGCPMPERLSPAISGPNSATPRRARFPSLHWRAVLQVGKRIYCIEGHWNYGSGKTEPSVEPILQMLAGLGHWPYARRDCATVEEMQYWIRQEWNLLDEGSVLYFATHGERGRIWLSDEYSVDVAGINANCTNCWVHFGGCNVLSVHEDSVRDLMSKSGATVVSGYAAEAGWADITRPPALALEMMLFSSAAASNVRVDDGRSRPRLKNIADKLISRFPDCGFRLHTKESMGL